MWSGAFLRWVCFVLCCFFFFNDTATTEIYTLSLHDALPISSASNQCSGIANLRWRGISHLDRKSTRLNSSHLVISYAVFCLKKKKQSKLRRVKHTPTRMLWMLRRRSTAH